MEQLDTNISNYGLQDILNLFSIPMAFTEAHLKHAKRVVLKTHPDKCSLPKEYFLFFTQAYRILYQIYTMRHEKAQGYAHAEKYRDLISQDGEKNVNVITNSKLSSMSPSEFNRWFNEAFDKYRVPDEERDAGYDDWFRNGDGEDVSTGPVSKTQWSASLESARSRMMALVPGSGSDPVSYGPGQGQGQGQGLQYEDLKRAHTETLIPITDGDVQTITRNRCNNVQELRTQRSNWSASFVPLNKTESINILNREKEHDSEQCTHRAYAMAKQDEIAREMNRKFMKEFKTICN
jgi:hypothetical protein